MDNVKPCTRNRITHIVLIHRQLKMTLVLMSHAYIYFSRPPRKISINLNDFCFCI